MIELKKYDIGTGKMMTVKELSNFSGINRETIYSRIKAGKSGRDLIKSPYQLKRYDIGDGKSMNINQLEKATSLTRDALYHRLERGIIGKDLVKKDTRTKDFLKKKLYDDGSGNKLEIQDIIRISGLSQSTVYKKIRNGISIKEILENE